MHDNKYYVFTNIIGVYINMSPFLPLNIIAFKTHICTN